MHSLVPLWRLREIRNAADTLAFRAACCPLAVVAIVSESKLLKPEAHIRLAVNPRLDLGEAISYVQKIKVNNPNDNSQFTVYKATICFNGDLTTKAGWKEAAQAVARELAEVAFFTPAAKRQLVCRSAAEKNQVIKTFADAIVNARLSEFGIPRPRFSLAKLREIVTEDLRPAARELEPHIRRLLLPHLGPDGW